jgi:photosystem II stability/assembly factor-like uncharacterized protein
VRSKLILAIALVAAVPFARPAAPLRAATPAGAFWTPVGPYGGVVVALAAFPSSPEVLYAGVDRGGVFRSDDAGLHWRSVSPGLPDLGVSALAVSPASSSLVVAGTASGLYVTVDGGISWTVAAGSPGSAISDIVFDAADPTVAYAVSPGGWAGRSVDGGVSWTQIAASLAAQQPMAIAVAPSAHTTIYLGTLQNGVYRSTDSGATFTEKNTNLTNLHVSALAVDPDNAQVIFAGTSNGGIFTTGDGGELWGPSGAFQGINALEVDAMGTAYAALNGGAVMLPRGTQQWVSAGPTQWVNALALGSGSPQRLFIGFGNLPFSVGGVARTEGNTTFVLVNGLTGVTVNSIAVDTMDLETRILLGTVGAGLLQSQDGAASWTPVSGLNQNSILEVQVVANPGEAFYVGTAAGISRSTDEGTTWTSVSNGIPTNPPTPVASLLIPSGGAAFLAGTYHGLYRSTDSAGSWSPVTAGLPAQVIYSLAGDPGSSDVVYAGTEEGVFKSTDGGANWSAANTGITGSLVYDVAVVGGAVFAAGEDGVFRSTDGGASWSELAGLPNAAAHAIAFDAAGSTLYAGTYAGVWESGDFGTTWTRVGAGPANPQIVSLGVLPEGRLLAGTFSGSAYLLSAPGVRETVVRVPPGNRVPRALPPRP